ncbi:nucleoporin seh1 [Lophiotrema nucula]|uniref:Nucleoporin seh1 n=1 Tax=Lophiotrema nucula TaxID=690887 RepID=A0A6A5Z1F0_9PLEO|nr:nucleoporin seh1 [Lophiotrema nucula]
MSSSSNDGGSPTQQALDAVTQRLGQAQFLSKITPSRLPSQAASDTSLSPSEVPLRNTTHRPLSPLDPGDAEPETLEADTLRSPLDHDLLPGGVFPVVSGQIRDQLEAPFVDACRATGEAKMASSSGITTFSHGHQDLVLAVDFNYYGNRMVTASSDHRLKVWTKHDESWSLVDSWKAHDAEIVDVKWNGPFMGEILGSIGEDGRFKLWQEEPTEVPSSGQRFKLLLTLSSRTNAPFMSLDFKNIGQETWLALITRDGHLSIYEPTDPSSLSDWRAIVEHWVTEEALRSEEVGFKVTWHKEKLPCWTAIQAGLDRKSLALAVASLNEVQIWRSDKAKTFYHQATLSGASEIIRDVAWANGSMRGFDIIATASKDGAIRIYELHTPQPEKTPTRGSSTATATETAASPSPSKQKKPAPSGIGAGLAGASKVPEQPQDHSQYPGRIHQVVKLTDTLTDHHGAVWRLAFSQMGDLLVSTGDDASIRTWKKAVNGNWTEYAEISTAE